MEKLCELCCKTFIVNEKNKRSFNKRFCTHKCAITSNGSKNKGKIRTNEVKKKMSIKKIGENNPMFGIKHSNELIEQIKKTQLENNLNKVKRCHLSELEKEILDGIMISDGCLTSKTNISARITLGFKYNETLEDIKENLPSIEFTKTNVIKNKTISYHNKSRMYYDLLLENKRWYVDNIKIIPIDFRLTNVSSYWWYICDGYNSNGNVYLCTNSFTKSDVEFLINKFKNLGFKCSITKQNLIRFYKESSVRFLEWITPKTGIHKQYLYKWKKK